MFDKQMKSLRAYVAAFNKHDAAAIAALYDEDAVFVERGEFVSIGGSAGSSIEETYQRHFAAFPDAATAIQRSWHRRDTVVFEYIEGGTHTGPRGAQKPTGKKVGYRGASVLTFNAKGLIAKDMTFYDQLTLEVQAGWAQGQIAKLDVRPFLPVPPATDSWDVHQVNGIDVGQPQIFAIRKNLYTSFSMRSEKDFLAPLADDIVFSAYDDPKDATGKRECARLFSEWTKTFSYGEINADDVWTVDGHVVLLGTFTGKHVGAWGPLKPTNKPFTSHFLDIARVGLDDKVQRVWTYANNAEILKDLGLRK